MKRIIYLLLLYFFSVGSCLAQTSIEQKLVLIENSKVLYGNFKIELQIKGSNLPATNTLGSATIDILYDSNKIRFINGSDWNPSVTFLNGYSNGIQSNNSETGTIRAIRVGILGLNVNANGGGVPPGYDVKNYYETIVRLNFIIINTTTPVSLNIKNITNQIGLFENLHNEPRTGIIINQILSTPINLDNIALPVLHNEEFLDNSVKISNYPNPFNNSTIINYTLPTCGYTQLSLFNINGKLLEILSNGYSSNGNFSKKLDFSNYSSGIYYFIIKHDNITKSIKLLIIK